MQTGTALEGLHASRGPIWRRDTEGVGNRGCWVRGHEQRVCPMTLVGNGNQCERAGDGSLSDAALAADDCKGAEEAEHAGLLFSWAAAGRRAPPQFQR